LSLLDLQWITDPDRRNLVENGYDIDNTGPWLSHNVTFDPSTPVNAPSPFPESLLPNYSLDIIDMDFIGYLGYEILSPILIGSVTRNPDTVGVGPEYNLHGQGASPPILQLGERYDGVGR
jgi:hypothetical protein